MSLPVVSSLLSTQREGPRVTKATNEKKEEENRVILRQTRRNPDFRLNGEKSGNVGGQRVEGGAQSVYLPIFRLLFETDMGCTSEGKTPEEEMQLQSEIQAKRLHLNPVMLKELFLFTIISTKLSFSM